MQAPSRQPQQDRRIDQRLTNVRLDVPPEPIVLFAGGHPLAGRLRCATLRRGRFQRLTLVVSFARTVTGLDRAVCDLSRTVYAPGMAWRGASPVRPCATTCPLPSTSSMAGFSA